MSQILVPQRPDLMQNPRVNVMRKSLTIHIELV